MNNVGGLPLTWCDAKISEITFLNPTLNKAEISDDLEISFVPMPAVHAESGVIDVSGKRKFSEVKKGYTPFREGDVLFAKITPCMENGKMAVVPEVRNGIGFGSTEFHVLRAQSGVDAKYVYYYVSSQGFRREAEHNMSGAVGQRRVTTPYLSACEVPLPPTNEQHRIVSKIEELFSELDKGIENLKAARAQLKVYRQALLKHAFEGKLTAQWRAEHQGKLETADALQKRIQQARAQRYQQQLADWENKSPSIPLLQRGKTSSSAASSIPPLKKGGRGDLKPKAPKPLPPLTTEELAELPELPEEWGWLKYGDLCSIVRNGISAKPEGDSGTPIFRISAVRPLFFDMVDIRFIDNATGEFDAYYLERGDLVFTRYNGSRRYVGVCAEYRSDEKRLFPDKLVQTRVFSKHMSTSYLEKALNSGASRKFVESKIRTTAGQSGVSGDDIKNIPVPFCSTDEQIQIFEELESKLSEVDQLDQTLTTSLQQAEALRQSILKKAFSGQLVPQDPHDEPASVLLARIKVERAAVAKSATVAAKPRKTAGRK